MNGNWTVNRSKIPFCSLGCDEALEHQNRTMKVVGGLTGITQQPRALARFFLNTVKGIRVSAKSTTDKAIFNDIIKTALLVLN